MSKIEIQDGKIVDAQRCTGESDQLELASECPGCGTIASEATPIFVFELDGLRFEACEGCLPNHFARLVA